MHNGEVQHLHRVQLERVSALKECGASVQFVLEVLQLSVSTVETLKRRKGSCLAI